MPRDKSWPAASVSTLGLAKHLGFRSGQVGPPLKQKLRASSWGQAWASLGPAVTVFRNFLTKYCIAGGGCLGRTSWNPDSRKAWTPGTESPHTQGHQPLTET